MRRFWRALLATLAIVVPALALAQSALLQGGAFQPGHVPTYSTSGGFQPIVIDGGGAAGGPVGVNPAEIGITARGTGTPPYVGQGTGPFGSIGCMYDAPTNNATGYHYLCFSPNATGNYGLIAYGAGGVATALPLNISLNGVNYAFPFTLAGVVGPATTVVGDFACWNNTTGTLLKDCGGVSTKVANYQIQITDCGKTIQAGTGSTGFFTVTLPSVSGFPATCSVTIVNSDTGRGKALSGFPDPTAPILEPTQAITVSVINGAWSPTVLPGRWKPTSNVNFYVDEALGNDANDGLAIGAGNAFATCQAGAIRTIGRYLDFSNSVTATINIPGATTGQCVVSTPWVGSNTNGGYSSVIVDGNNTGSITSATGNGLVSATVRGVIQVQNITLNCGSGGIAILGHWQGHVYLNGTVNIVGSSCLDGIYLSGNSYLNSAGLALNVSGSFTYVLQVINNSVLGLESDTINVNGNISYTAFGYGNGFAILYFGGTSIANGGAFTTTGLRFQLADYARIQTNNDAGNLNFLPGNAPGVTQGAGSYDELPPVNLADVTYTVKGTLALGNGGTGGTDAATARTSLAVPGLATNNSFSGQIISTTGLPTIASGACGTTTNGAVVAGSTNQSGHITIGAASTTTCILSWSATLAATPGACMFFPENAAAAATGTTVARVSALSTASVTLTGSALANANYAYLCL